MRVRSQVKVSRKRCVPKIANVPSVNVPVRQEESVQSDVQLPNVNKEGTSCMLPESSVQANRSTDEARYPARIRKEAAYLKDLVTYMTCWTYGTACSDLVKRPFILVTCKDSLGGKIFYY